ncbi:MAG: glycosyltransferase [Armatimonadota bacterium]|nr:glycosyltransferase [Armatimonadota bacterium]MDR5696201.1 glycosyltransferase [Armatimonadota bacterium]
MTTASDNPARAQPAQAGPAILVLSATYGGGHQRVAEVLDGVWRETAPGVRVEIVDFFDAFVNPTLNHLTRSLYINSVRHAPRLWGAFYYATGNIRPDSPTQKWINRLGRRRLAAYIREHKPDVVVHTHPTPAGVMSDLKAESIVDRPAAVVITDYAIHSQWIHPHVERYCVATDEIRAGLEDRGIPPERITVTGIPIDPVFATPMDRTEAARRLGLDPARTTVLVMAGAYAMLGGVVDVHRVLMHSSRPVQAVFICGRDPALVERLRQRSRRRPDFHVHGYVTNVHEWMSAADLLVTKAGGITVSEALAKELPMVVYRPIPGQEDWNTRTVAGAGAAKVARDPEDLARVLDALLADPGEIESMRRAARRLKRPRAAHDVARVVLDLVASA